MQAPAVYGDVRIDPATGSVAIFDRQGAGTAGMILWSAIGLVAIALTAGLLIKPMFAHRGLLFAKKGTLKALVMFYTAVPSLALTAIYRTVQAWRRMRDAPADLVIDSAGLHDHWLGAGKIPWSRIESAKLVQPPWPRKRPYITLWARDDESLIAGMPFGARLHAKLSRLISGEKIHTLALSQDGGGMLGIEPGDLAWLLQRHIPILGIPADYRPSHPALIELITLAVKVEASDAREQQ